MIKTRFEIFLSYLTFKELLYLQRLEELEDIYLVSASLKFSKSEVNRIKQNIKKKAEIYYGKSIC